MKVPGIIVLAAVSALATACSSGSSGVPVVTAPPAGQNSTEETSPEPEAPTGPAGLIPALPGLVEYSMPEQAAVAAVALAAEADDFPWSQNTEDRILSAISGLIEAPDTLVAVECRTTMCGLVVDGPDARESDLAWEIADRLRTRFVTTAVAIVGVRHPGGAWIAVYVLMVRMV